MISIILASGFSRRMGKNKLLLPYKEKPILQWVIEGALQLNSDKVVLVYRDKAIKTLYKNWDIKLIYNKDAIKGQSSSVIKGVQSACEYNQDYLFLMGDQPLIDIDEIKNMIRAYKNSTKSIALPLYNKNPGTPVIFSKGWKNQLLNLRGDSGGRSIIKNNKEEVLFYPIKNKIMELDIDTEKDYGRLVEGVD